MSHKKILYGDEARKAVFEGVTIVNRATSCTLGPKGRNSALKKSWGSPTITNDGVSIAREITLEDQFQDMGAQIVKEVAEKTNELAGDGTTTSILLTQSIISEGLKRINVGVNAIEIKNGINKAAKIAVDYLKSMARPIKNDSELIQVASISAESKEIGKIISDTISKLGKDTVITVEESPTVGILSEVSQGMEFDRGFISPYMMTNPERAEAECKDVKILVTDLKIGVIQEILPLLEQVMATGKRELVIIADDIVAEALHTFVINKIRGALTVLGIKAPGFGNRKKDYLQDIATLTGATFISSDIGMTIDKVYLEHLGSADRVISTKDKTTIVGGKGKKEDIEARIAMAREELKGLESKHDKIKVEERIAKLMGGVAIIKVGAATETEAKYLKLKIEDAVSAVKAATEEGVVVGGGVTLIRASQVILDAGSEGSEGYTNRDFMGDGGYTADELFGFDILAKALELPLRQIAINCGLGDGSMVVAKVKEMKENGGYDALNNKYVENMFDAGIVDPVKVIRLAIENSCSAAGTMLTLESAIVEIKDDKKEI